MPISHLSQNERRTRIGYAPQGEQWLPGDIADTITGFATSNSEDSAIETAKAIGLHSSICALPRGYSTRIEEALGSLSQGQRRRLALARAFHGTPQLVVLDDPFADLDGEGETALNRMITAARRRGTIVIATSKRRLAKSAIDRVVIIEGGALKCAPAKVSSVRQPPDANNLDDQSASIRDSASEDLMTRHATQPRNALVVIDPQLQNSGNPFDKSRFDIATKAGSDLLNRALLGLIGLTLTVAAIGGWSATMELSGAVMAPGQVTVEGDSKKVQHPVGGVVKAIHVRNGDRVGAGALLVSLESVQSSAELAVLDARIVQLESEQARLVAEQEGRTTIELPASLDTNNVQIAGAIHRDRRLFEARRSESRQPARTVERAHRASSQGGRGHQRATQREGTRAFARAPGVADRR